MRSVMRMRHYCDFCTKQTGTKQSMLKHEARCTANPNRKCGMCEMLGEVQKPISELIEAYETGFNALRKAANECPACILAAQRQFWKGRAQDEGFGWDHPANTEQNGWNFKDACKEFWEHINTENRCINDFY